MCAFIAHRVYFGKAEKTFLILKKKKRPNKEAKGVHSIPEKAMNPTMNPGKY